MKSKRGLFILSALILLLFSSVSTAGVPVEVESGKGTVITLKKASKRVNLGDPAIADINLISPTEILVTGKAPGATSLIVWDTEGKTSFFDVKVYSRKCGDTAALEARLKEIAPSSDIKAECEGNTLVLRGEIKNRVSCRRDKEPVVTRRDPNQMTEVIETEEKEVCVETVNRIEQVAKYFSSNVMNLVTIPAAEQIILEVKVAHINKTKLRDLGMSTFVEGFFGSRNNQGFVGFPDGSSINSDAKFDGFNTASLAPQFGVTNFPSGVSVFLTALDEQGAAKILAEPNLIVRSGEKGEFTVGEEVPIQVVESISGGGVTPSILYKKVGIILNFVPQVLENGAIRLRIDPAQVSSILEFLTFSSGLSAPRIDTREVRTSVDLKEGESLILAGLLSEEMKKNIKKVPLLGEIPILGALFRSTDEELTQKELAFFITPRFVKPIPPGERPLIPGERKLTPEEEEDLEWIPLPETKKEEPKK